MATWADCGELDLLDELYRIVTEIRGHILFGRSLGCFQADSDLHRVVDGLLGFPNILLGGRGEGQNRFHAEMLRSVLRCTKVGSVGHILREGLESGALSDEEVVQTASVYTLAQAPTMALFWALFRAARDGCAPGGREAIRTAIRRELVEHPPVPSMFTRYASAPIDLPGLHIPKGATVVISPMLLHHGASGCPVARLRWAIPFGVGQHTCQGRRYAMEELQIVLEEVWAAVELEVVDDGGLAARQPGEQLRLHVYARPRNDVRVRVRAGL